MDTIFTQVFGWGAGHEPTHTFLYLYKVLYCDFKFKWGNIKCRDRI